MMKELSFHIGDAAVAGRAGRSGQPAVSGFTHLPSRSVRSRKVAGPPPASLRVLCRLEEDAENADFTGCPCGSASREALSTTEEWCAGHRLVHIYLEAKLFACLP